MDFFFIAEQSQLSLNQYKIGAKLQESGVKAILIGCDGWDTDSFFSLGGNKINEGYFINHWLPISDGPLTSSFLGKFARKEEVKALTALTYDATYVLAEAIKRAGSTRSADIRNSLYNLQGFTGVTGEIHFNEQGDTSRQACIVEIREGVPYYLKCYSQE